MSFLVPAEFAVALRAASGLMPREVLEQIWDSLAATPDAVPITAAQNATPSYTQPCACICAMTESLVL